MGDLIPAHFIAIVIGFLLDRLIGDPPHWPHPIRWIGDFISKVTSLLNKGRYRTVKGAILLMTTGVLVFMIVLILTVFAYRIHLFFGIAVESVMIAIGLAQKSLRDAGLSVYNPLVKGDLTEARKKLSWIVGRDTEQLNESEIARGAIETVSENTADGVTSPLFWAFLLGAPGLWLYKAVNTLDSMVGYKDERYEQFGLFSARADDVLNYIPARITGLLIILCAPNPGRISFWNRFKGWWTDAHRHQSPNSGYLEAATAWQLGVTLGGVNTYRGQLSKRAKMGPGNITLNASHIKSSIKEMYIVSVLFLLLMILIGVLINAIA